jgi:hypothetical protein
MTGLIRIGKDAAGNDRIINLNNVAEVRTTPAGVVQFRMISETWASAIEVDGAEATYWQLAVAKYIKITLEKRPE